MTALESKTMTRDVAMFEAGAQHERKAVVEWLRKDIVELRKVNGPISDWQAEAIEECADAIAAGKHLQGEE